MWCLWPRAKADAAVRRGKGAARIVLRFSSILLVLLLVFQDVPMSSSILRPFHVGSNQTSSSESERKVRRASAHVLEFAPIQSILAMSACESVQPAEALLTPDPLMPLGQDSLFVRVSFIIGSDGHVHSAFVLYSGGAEEDAAVLEAVRGWRYRPALCNGVPTDSEARIRFTIPE